MVMPDTVLFARLFTLIRLTPMYGIERLATVADTVTPCRQAAAQTIRLARRRHTHIRSRGVRTRLNLSLTRRLIQAQTLPRIQRPLRRFTLREQLIRSSSTQIDRTTDLRFIHRHCRLARHPQQYRNPRFVAWLRQFRQPIHLLLWHTPGPSYRSSRLQSVRLQFFMQNIWPPQIGLKLSLRRSLRRRSGNRFESPRISFPSWSLGTS